MVNNGAIVYWTALNLHGLTEQFSNTVFVQTTNKKKDKPTGFAANVKFWGADYPQNQAPPPPQRWQTSIKIEIIIYEMMFFTPVIKPVHHGYSDTLIVTSMGIPCYSLHETSMAEYSAKEQIRL